MSNELSFQIKYLLPYEYDYLESLSPGVAHKVSQQVKAMNTNETECELICLPSQQNKLGKILKRLPGFSDGIKWNCFEQGKNFDVIYLRKPDFFSKEMLGFLENIKMRDPKKVIILEIPTYPYDSEISSFSQLPKLIKDKIHRRDLNHYIDAIVSLVEEENIFGVKNIPIINGINLDSVSERKSCCNTNIVNILCVAAFASWHGADRILKGIAQYNGDRPIKLYLAGDGPAMPELKKLAHELGIADQVVFCGMCKRRQLDEIYNNCTLAIASLGLHRIGLELASTLKTREYLAKGIPFVYSGEIDVFQKEPVDFCLQIPANEEPVDVERLIQFHDRLYLRKKESDLITEIRAYAERNVSMDAAMKPVIDYVREAVSER